MSPRAPARRRKTGCRRIGWPPRRRRRARACPPSRSASAASTSASSQTFELDDQAVRRPLDLTGADGDDDQQPRACVTSLVTCASSASESAFGPLHVVQDQDEPGLLGDRGDEAGDGVEERKPVAANGLAGQLGRQPRDLIEAVQCRGGPLRPDQREPAPQDPPPRPVRGRALRGGAADPTAPAPRGPRPARRAPRRAGSCRSPARLRSTATRACRPAPRRAARRARPARRRVPRTAAPRSETVPGIRGSPDFARSLTSYRRST